MHLHELLRLHQTFKHHHSLSDVLGDGYLMIENSIFRNVREMAVALNYKFIPAWSQYLIMSLGQLPRIVAEKTIPYKSNVELLTDIEKQQPHHFLLNDLPTKLPNYHMHETAHVLAESVFDQIPMTKKNDVILKALMCESFANTVESMALSFATNDTHKVFLSQNTYFELDAEQVLLRQQIIADVGFKSAFRLIYYSFLFSNFLYKSCTFKEFSKLIPFIFPEQKLSAPILKKSYQIFLLGFNLNESFRLKATEFYFGTIGYNDNIFKLLDFDFLARITKSAPLRQAIEQMADMTQLGIHSVEFSKLATNTALLRRVA